METRPTDDTGYARILEQHQELKCLLARIDQELVDRKSTVEEVSSLLGQLGDKLIKHFALEEEGSCFSDLMVRAPQLVARANDLMAQHPKICTHVRELVVEIGSGKPAEDWWQETKRRFDAFRAELLKHETHENRLLQEAYTQDIGAHD